MLVTTRGEDINRERYQDEGYQIISKSLVKTSKRQKYPHHTRVHLDATR